MPARQSQIMRIESTEVQGDDSFVVLRKLTVGEVEILQKRKEREKWTDYLFGMRILASRIVEWNWVDGDGNPLAQPSDKPEVIRLLTEDETKWLAEQQGLTSEADAKN